MFLSLSIAADHTFFTPKFMLQSSACMLGESPAQGSAGLMCILVRSIREKVRRQH